MRFKTEELHIWFGNSKLDKKHRTILETKMFENLYRKLKKKLLQICRIFTYLWTESAFSLFSAGWGVSDCAQRWTARLGFLDAAATVSTTAERNPVKQNITTLKDTCRNE